MSGGVTVWDEPGDAAGAPGEVWYWQHYAERDGAVSVPQYLEEHADRLKARYLAFVYELGDQRVAGSRLVERLEWQRGFSFWWMTQIAEKSPFKSPRIYCCLRLLALEELLRTRRPAAVTLCSADRALGQAMRRLCENLGITFMQRRSARGMRRWSVRRLYDALPFPVRAVITLGRHLASRWALRETGVPAWFGGPGSVCLFSYFIHLDPVMGAAGQFHSRQWGALPSLLRAHGQRTNWIHHFMRSPAVPDVATARRWVERFNRDAEAQGHHALVDSYLGVAVVVRTVAVWLWLMRRSARLRGLPDAFYAKGSAAWLWPLLRTDWLSSVRGPVAITNCLWAVIFDRALRGMPRQERGFYLYEGQGWERAMLHAWRRHGHGEIVGVQHATVPYWHLYYFDDPRSWDAASRCPMPLPDRLAVNGPLPHRAFADGGFPADRLIGVEALRYLDLASAAAHARARRDPHAGAPAPGPIRVLILGDMMAETMHTFLALIEGAVPLLPDRFSFSFKPHPGYVPHLAAYPGLPAEVTADALDKILGQFDVALSANSTSAAADAYGVGIPLIVMLDGASLNMSPLRGQPAVCFVSDSAALAQALTAMASAGARGAGAGDLFTLDPAMPRWIALLSAPARG